MSSARPNTLFRSTSFRLSAAYAVLLIVAFVVTAVMAWSASKEATEQLVRERIRLEMNALQEEMRVESVEAAILDIKSHIEQPGALEYRWVDSAGRRVVGNLPVDNPEMGWGLERIRRQKSGRVTEQDFITLTQPTLDGSVLTIAADLQQAQYIRSAVLKALLWTAPPTLLVLVGIGVLIAYKSTRRLSALSQAMTQVGGGDLAVRVPDAGSDEIAFIGAGVNEMVERIDRLIMNVRRVSTDIAHDLRTPLTHVRQDLEAAAQSADLPTREEIRAAQNRIDDVLRTFNAILRLAEIDADSGSARARFTSVNLPSVVERVTDAYRPDIEASGRFLNVDDIELSSITGDPDLVALALGNLIENAMRHTPAGTAITVGVRQVADQAELTVADQGPGIPATEHQRALAPFGRLDSSRSTPGSGLGLSIVSAIARVHGAHLTLEDARPGLCVRIAWPAAGKRGQEA